VMVLAEVFLLVSLYNTMKVLSVEEVQDDFLCIVRGGAALHLSKDERELWKLLTYKCTPIKGTLNDSK
jgi:hypothetical protein